MDNWVLLTHPPLICFILVQMTLLLQHMNDEFYQSNADANAMQPENPELNP